MCNNYTVRKSAAEVAAHFGVEPPDIRPFNAAQDVFPGYPGMVVRTDQGRRVLDAMAWGFPRRLKTMKPESKPLKVNNARDDKLYTSFWKDSFLNRRCLIPVTAWAEAEGEKGRMTKTWYALHDVELFGVGGIWRTTAEWGNAYSMVMVDGCPQMAEVHDRMPVLLRPDQYEQWISGTSDDAFALVRTCHEELKVDRSAELWSNRSGLSQAGPLP